MKPRMRSVAAVTAGVVAVAAVGLGVVVPAGGLSRAIGPTVPDASENPVLAPFPSNGDGGPTTPGVRRALSQWITAASLGPTVRVGVYDASSGKPIFEQGVNRPATPASVNKLMTAAAVLTAYGADYRIKTTVVAGASPNEIVLVGGGDPLLTTHRPDGPLTPATPASLAELADHTAAKLKESNPNPTVTLNYDDSLFVGPTAAPSWPNSYVSDGLVSAITALIVDGGSAGNPSASATAVFAALLRNRGVAVTGPPSQVSKPDSQRPTLAKVASAPLSTSVQEMLTKSDNTTAEMLGHLAGVAVGGQGSFAGGVNAVVRTLADLQVSAVGVSLVDASGLSRSNLLPARALSGLINRISQNTNPQLWAATYGLPVAGFSGTLSDRFSTQATEPGRGEVRAKTGTLTGVRSLAGIVTTVDGDLLTFTFLADDVVDGFAAAGAWDGAAAALAQCGCQ